MAVVEGERRGGRCGRAGITTAWSVFCTTWSVSSSIDPSLWRTIRMRPSGSAFGPAKASAALVMALFRSHWSDGTSSVASSASAFP